MNTWLVGLIVDVGATEMMVYYRPVVHNSVRCHRPGKDDVIRV